LVATAAKCPAAVFGRRAIASEKHTTHIAGLSGMVECGKKFVNCVWAKGVTHLWAVEGNAHCAMSLCPMVRNVGEVKLRNLIPLGGIKNVGNGHDNIVPSSEVRNLIFVMISC
jgi:hypothetical protein